VPYAQDAWRSPPGSPRTSRRSTHPQQISARSPRRAAVCVERMSSTFPDSFRAATTIETVGRFTAGAPTGRAITKLVRARCLIGQSLTRNRFASESRRGTPNGSSISGQCRSTSKPPIARRFAVSLAVNQFCCSTGRAHPSRAATARGGSHSLLYELRMTRVRGVQTRSKRRNTSSRSQTSCIRSDKMTKSNCSSDSNSCASA
jgi:hypothetical protein